MIGAPKGNRVGKVFFSGGTKVWYKPEDQDDRGSSVISILAQLTGFSRRGRQFSNRAQIRRPWRHASGASRSSEVAIFGPPLPPISFRPRRTLVAIGALAALALLFGMHFYRWHVPYRLEGIVGELPLLGCALIVGGITGVALPRFWLRLSRAGLATAAVSALVAFAVLQALDPFVAQRDWCYAPEGCEFAVLFPRRPDFVAGEVRLGEKQTRIATRAVLTNVGEASTLSAECLVFERPIADADRAAVLAAAEGHLKNAAARLRLKIESVAREGGDNIVLTGSSDEGRTATNEILLRRAKANVVLGRSSLLIVWGWRIERERDARRLSPLAGLGIEAARPR